MVGLVVFFWFGVEVRICNLINNMYYNGVFVFDKDFVYLFIIIIFGIFVYKGEIDVYKILKEENMFFDSLKEIFFIVGLNWIRSTKLKEKGYYLGDGC